MALSLSRHQASARRNHSHLNLTFGSALLRGSLFLVRKKSNQKKRTPGSRAGELESKAKTTATATATATAEALTMRPSFCCCRVFAVASASGPL
ncbi:MAG: hypothetical protein M0Q15_00680 [Nevskia sp.]|nr:hypothetical protein [Nevskia sp.]